MQDILGHQDISTTMNIYADVTKELREKELGNLEAYFAKQKG
jgi:site-specific recombinase XerD